MFKDLPQGQTHYCGDGCQPPHVMPHEEKWREQWSKLMSAWHTSEEEIDFIASQISLAYAQGERDGLKKGKEIIDNLEKLLCSFPLKSS